jgi:uncharacterized protein (DUF4213/DUF364 family)
VGKCKELHVLDMRPPERLLTTVISAGGVQRVPSEVKVHPVADSRNVLGRATAVSITGSALVNGTMEELLSYARKARLIAVYGASAGMIPDVLLDRGVHMVHSSLICNPDTFELGLTYDLNMEAVMEETQRRQTIRRRVH